MTALRLLLVSVLVGLSVALAAPVALAGDEDDDPRDLDGDGAIVLPRSYWTMIGRIENVKLGPNGPIVKAKIDTGARTSSIDARKIERFKDDGDDWVRFELETNDGEALAFERPVIRTTNIKNSAGVDEDRPVIELPLCIAGVYQRAQVTLANRAGLNYRFLLGREALERGQYLVNVSQAFSGKPTCDRDITVNDVKPRRR